LENYNTMRQKLHSCLGANMFDIISIMHL
jgi:hypothetical protein